MSYIFFHAFIHVHSPRAGADNPFGDKILMVTERPYHFAHLLQVSRKSLRSPILDIFFHVFIHVYSPGVGADKPLGSNFYININLLSLWSFVISFFHKMTF